MRFVNFEFLLILYEKCIYKHEDDRLKCPYNSCVTTVVREFCIKYRMNYVMIWHSFLKVSATTATRFYFLHYFETDFKTNRDLS